MNARKETPMAKTQTYTCKGPVRGSCGHEHRSLETAAECLRRDVNACRRLRGYSDRRVVGHPAPLTEAEDDAVRAAVNR